MPASTRRTPPDAPTGPRGFLSRAAVGVVMLAVAVLASVQPAAWGLDIHRRITARALDGLPEPLKTFYATERAFVVEHSVDPDMWRVVNLQTTFGPESLNHFLDIDDLGEAEPWTAVPRDWKAFRARYGAQRADRAGHLPWRLEEIYNLLVAAWKSHASGRSGYALSDARYLSAIVAHYLADANQPFHAVANHDGQLTGQRGLHSRFETELALRYWDRLTHPRVVVSPVPDIKAFVFTRLTEGAQLSREVLEADRKATRTRGASGQAVYNDAYYAAFFQQARPALETRVASSVNSIASVLVQAWTDAGRPRIR